MESKKIPNSTLTEALIHATRKELTSTDSFDIHAELRKVLESAGLSPEDCGGSISFKGKDPIVPSALRIGAAAGITLTAKSVAVAKIWKMRGGKGQDISMDIRKSPRRLCPFYEMQWELLSGYPPFMPSDPASPFGIGFYKTRDNRWVMPANPYMRLRSAVLQFLDCSDSKEKVANSILQWDSHELEEAAAKIGVVMPVVRTVEEFMAEPAYAALADIPIIEIEKIGESKPEPFPQGAAMPLEGVRALGMGRVIAGAGIGRTLALHGADCLNIWRPFIEYEHEFMYYSANVGVRSATLDPQSDKGRKVMHNLLREADVFYNNRRIDFIERLGLTPQECAELRPGIIHCSVNLHGTRGPWKFRPGFDQTAGCITGVMALEGTPDDPKVTPILVVNDYMASWLAATGIMAALAKRAVEGGSYRVHVSLTRVALWLITLGIFDKEFVRTTVESSEEHRYLAPDLFTAETVCGDYQGVTDQVEMSETPGAYNPVLIPRGSCRPEWLPRK